MKLLALIGATLTPLSLGILHASAQVPTTGDCPAGAGFPAGAQCICETPDNCVQEPSSPVSSTPSGAPTGATSSVPGRRRTTWSGLPGRPRSSSILRA